MSHNTKDTVRDDVGCETFNSEGVGDETLSLEPKVRSHPLKPVEDDVCLKCLSVSNQSFWPGNIHNVLCFPNFLVSLYLLTPSFPDFRRRPSDFFVSDYESCAW